MKAGVVLAGMVLAAGSVGALGYNGQTGTWQNVALPGSGTDCSGTGCANAGANASPGMHFDEANQRANVCVFGPDKEPGNPPGPGLNAGAGTWNGQDGQGVGGWTGGCANTDVNSTGMRFDGGAGTFAPTEPGHHLGTCVQSGGSPTSTGARLDADGFPVQAGNC